MQHRNCVIYTTATIQQSDIAMSYINNVKYDGVALAILLRVIITVGLELCIKEICAARSLIACAEPDLLNT